jgi:hypothetical protein
MSPYQCTGTILAEEKNKRKKRKGKGREKRKGKRKKKGKKERERLLWTFHLFIHLTQSGEAVLPNVFLKQFQIHLRIYSTGIATAGATTTATTARPNGTYRQLLYLDPVTKLFIGWEKFPKWEERVE